MASAPNENRPLSATPDVVTQLQEQVALLSSHFYNYVGGLAAPQDRKFASLAEELEEERARARQWHVDTLGANFGQAQAQMEKLADSLPNENAAELEQRIGALQAENAALEVQLRESLARAETKIADLRAATAEVANAALQEQR